MADRGDRAGRGTHRSTGGRGRGAGRGGEAPPHEGAWREQVDPGLPAVRPHLGGTPPLDPDARAEAVSELEGLRREIDALDVRIVGLLNERARLGLAVGQAKLAAGWSGIRDPKREREVLLRVTTANDGPLPQADLLAIYRRLIAATRSLEDADRSPIGPDAAVPDSRP